MGSPFLISGDSVVFPANFCADAVTPEVSVPITGTGKANVGGKPVCVAGDEAKVVAACSYTTSAFTIPGAATLKIKQLASAQQSQVATSATRAAILATDEFDIEMTVTGPASVVNAAGVTQTDTTATYTGKGRFKSENTAAMASK